MVGVHTYRLSIYPKTVTLRSGTDVVLKPMEPQDADALVAFFKTIPDVDRYYLKEDVASPEVIARWAADMDYDRALPLLAWVDGAVVGDATLHRTRTMARRHLGEIRVVVAPAYRSQGLGTTLIHELAAIANEHGLERLLFEAVAGREDDAIRAAEYQGFVRVAVLPEHGKDRDGHHRDIVLMEMPLGKWFEWWSY